MRVKKVNDIELLLSKLDREQLCGFIRKECANDKQFQLRFLALGAGTLFAPKPADYQNRIKSLIRDFEGRHGYVEYFKTFDLNRAVYRILDEADTAMREHRWGVAIAILEGIAITGDDIINCGDDSAGELSGIVDECFAKWHEICSEELLPIEIKSEIFELSINYFTKGTLADWEWWWDWIQIAISLADTPEKQERIIKTLDRVINNTKGDEWSIERNSRTAQRYKLEVMAKNGTPEEQRKFMYDNVENPDFRKRLLQMAWDKEDYNEVLRLAKDGVAHDSNLAGLVNDWHKWALKVYRHKNDNANTLKLARYFFFTRNGFGDNEYSMATMYALMKSIVCDEEWSDFVGKLIKDASKNKDEVRILFIYTQEKMWDKYMEYLRTSISTYILDAAPLEVWELYKDELMQLYALCIKRFFQYASTRNEYCEGVAQLRKLIELGGKIEADAIKEEQKARTPRRPALIDELSKL